MSVPLGIQLRREKLYYTPLLINLLIENYSPSIPARKVDHQAKLEQLAGLAKQRYQRILEAIVRDPPDEYLHDKHVFHSAVFQTNSKEKTKPVQSS